MGLHMMHRQQGNVQRERQRLGKLRSYQQRTDQPGRLCKGDGGQISRSAVRLFQRRLHHRHDILHMCPAGQFRYYAAILFMYRLSGDDIGQDDAIAADRTACFVTGRFDGQDGDGLLTRWLHGAKLPKRKAIAAKALRAVI
jgi:hypothetical protein